MPTATPARRISATDAARTFSDLLNRVQYRGETIVVERNGAAVCEISPAKPLAFMLSELAGLLRTPAKPDAGYWDLVEVITRNQPVVEPSPWAR
jgi:antitoxin (DNA-binding transcriptional repressor) of toxin-antitoxin stability system